jgi:molybdate transport system ATP-binding protein
METTVQPLIKLTAACSRKPEWSMAHPVDFTLYEGEHIAIVGRNGTGKTMLADMITGAHPTFPDMAEYHFRGNEGRLVSENIRSITFRDTYGGDNDRTYFLQQRWNQTEIDPDTPTVGDKLEEAYRQAGADTPERRAFRRHLCRLFHMDGELQKHIILLSSGELRKLRIASALFGNPRVLIMDNPFIGLDATTRDQLRELLTTLSREQRLQLILVLSKTDEIPDFITHVVEVSNRHVLPKTTLNDYLAGQKPVPPHVLSEEKRRALLSLPPSPHPIPSEEVISFNRVTIRYGARTILRDLDWKVMNGDRWAISGQNGAGKSTLLSLVCADNPQSYACDITLFGHRRGSGESIWDIKRRIGYVSPEMQRSYQRDIPAIRIVASGLKDSIGLYARITPEEMDRCRWWMHIFGIEHLAERSVMRMSAGEHRLVLLARAFVKDPELLILDEPLHGLDLVNRRLVKDIIETFCERPGKTLIFVSHYKDEYPACINKEIHLQRRRA